MYTVGDFMTRKADLHVVKPTTTVEEGFIVLSFMLFYLSLVCSRLLWHMIIVEDCLILTSFARLFLGGTALEMLVHNRITGFPVIDDDWKLVRFFRFVVSVQIEAVNVFRPA